MSLYIFNFRNPIIKFVFRMVVFFIVTFAILEVFFRDVIPANQSPYAFWDEQFSLLRFDTSKVRTGVFTSGRLAEQRSIWRVNNYGWNSGIDYMDSDSRQNPSIAIIGDSYIEGLYVNWEQHSAAILQEKLGNNYSVYSFGSSGAPLSQFIRIADYAEYNFAPDIFIFQINQLDVESSLRTYYRDAQSLQFDYDGSKFVEIEPQPYIPSHFKRLVRKSALVRYILINANMPLFGFGTPDLIENTGSEPIPDETEKRRILQLAADYIVTRLHEEHPNTDLVFWVDADREKIYEMYPMQPTPIDSSLYLEKACAKHRRCYFLDLTEAFYLDYQKNGRKFNFEHNYHWNAYGFQIATDELFKFLNLWEIVSAK